jgi:hypothetical protein
MSYLGQVELKSSEIRRIDVTGSTSATHTLTWTPPSEQSLIITINGVKQQNNYSFSGTTLTLDTALIVTDAMEVIGILDIGEAVTPPDDSISTIKIQDDAVTAAKLANSINTEITANTAKVTNATHTGDVTGATALTIATDAVDIAMLSATGVADATTFLRGDNAWAAAGGTNTPAFMATMGGSAQSVADSTNTKVEMSVEVFDTDSTYDPTTNYRWTPGVVGKYHIGFSVYMEGNTIHREWVKIYKNGSSSLPQTFTQAYTGGGYHPDRSTQVNSCVIDVTNVADYFEVWCWIDTDNSSATPVQDASLTFFWGYRLLT